MKKVFLKSLLLLCALMVGSGNVWGEDITVVSWTARTASDGADTYTTGFTYSTNKINGKAGYVQDSGTKDADIVNMTLYSTSDKLFSATPSTITFHAKLGGGSTKDPLGYNVYACFVDNTGAEIAGSEVVVTTKITNKNGSDFSVSMPLTKAANAYGIKIRHMKEDGYNVRYFSFSLSYEPPTESKASAPAFSLISGGYIYGTTFTISSTNSEKIYYTTDGNDPTTSSAEYAGPIAITSTMTVKAMAVDDEDQATIVTSRTYSVKTPAAPTFSIPEDNVTKGTSVTVSAEALCVISYTTDGSDPATSGTATLTGANTAEVIINETTRIRAIAIDGNTNEGEEASSTYTVLDENVMLEEKTSFTFDQAAEVSGKIGFDITWTAYKGGATTDPANYNSGIRLYQKSGTATYGGYVTLTAPSGFIIKQVQITATSQYTTCPVTYTEGTSMDVTTNPSYNLAKEATYKVSTNNQKVNIFCLGSGSSQRLEIGGIKVYYVGSGEVAINEVCYDGTKYYATYSNHNAFIVPSGVTVSEVTITAGVMSLTNYDEGDVVASNTGVLISSDNHDSKSITFTGKAGTNLGVANTLHPGGVDAEGMTAAAPGCKYYKLALEKDGEGYVANTAGFYWGAEGGAAFASSANKAYLAVPTGASAPSHFMFNEEVNGATNIENIEADEKAVKFIENGRILILRDGIAYDALGRKVR